MYSMVEWLTVLIPVHLLFQELVAAAVSCSLPSQWPCVAPAVSGFASEMAAQTIA